MIPTATAASKTEPGSVTRESVTIATYSIVPAKHANVSCCSLVLFLRYWSCLTEVSTTLLLSPISRLRSPLYPPIPPNLFSHSPPISIFLFSFYPPLSSLTVPLPFVPCVQPTLPNSSPVSSCNYLSHQPPPSDPLFFAWRLVSLRKFFSPSYFRKFGRFLIVQQQSHMIGNDTWLYPRSEQQ